MLGGMGLGAAFALYTGRARKCQILGKPVHIIQRLSRATCRKCQHMLHHSEDQKNELAVTLSLGGFFLTLHSFHQHYKPPPNTEQHWNRLNQQWSWAESHRAAVALQHWWTKPVKSWFRISAEVFQKGWAIWVSSTADGRCSNWGIQREKGNYAAE